jgi:hypothetical protein
MRGPRDANAKFSFDGDGKLLAGAGVAGVGLAVTAGAL